MLEEWTTEELKEIYSDLEHTKQMLEYARKVGDLEMVKLYAQVIARLL
jgi:hypothetical protein